ncbi:DUF4837 family protein [Antarcticibacterium flavum]|uniref:DUF4837 family protein n=1 Tax=Antarcticibacterium flavum TaxID=2058175 RepID=A0A5B7X4G9_9FLAO|nr:MULTISPECIES: DUF4837 family protein [Antarcticibacterium]MCM4159210.1 DUF4837 domain-containing protein [Antarcticibacterium sp. W02-3]QCY69608.1 DUF4837 family protein [Antarcticibacterium flavum]
MKNILFSLVFTLLLVGCNNGEEDERILATSSGNINNVTVVMENDRWEGSIGEALRNTLAAPVDGLPQEEPLFSLNQMPPEAFTGFVRKNRLFIKIEQGKDANFGIFRETFAKPQTGVLITGQNTDEIVDQIYKNAEEIVRTFKNTEIKEKQRRIRKSLKDDSRLKEQLGVSLKFPTAYRYAIEDEDFFWIRKDIPKGMMELMVYEVPLHVIEKDTNIIANIIRMRDSIGQAHIPGPVEGSYMITEEAYAPYLFESQLDGKFAWETRGTWEVKGAFMAGPFINYAVRDSVNNRYVVLEGFAFSPATGKRDNMFELDAILQSLRIE